MKDCSDDGLARAEQACIHYNWPIHIKEVVRSISMDDVDDSQYPSLTIDFYGYRIIDDLLLGLQALIVIITQSQL